MLLKINYNFIKVSPSLTFNIIDNSSEILNGTASLFKKNSYIISCSSFSNPSVKLNIYDSKSLVSLSNSYNSNSTMICYSYGGCTTNLTVNLKISGNQYDSMSSITCATTSSNPQVSLSESKSQDVVVLSESKYNFFLNLVLYLSLKKRIFLFF